MEKSTFQRTLQAFKNAGVEKYMVCIGGDNNRMFNNETSIVVDKGDYVVIFNLCDNVGNLTMDAVYDVAVLDYGNISNLKAEFLIPTVVDELVHEGRATVKVLQTPSQWFGVTYKEDKPQVVKALADLVEKGYYKKGLY